MLFSFSNLTDARSFFVFSQGKYLEISEFLFIFARNKNNVMENNKFHSSIHLSVYVFKEAEHLPHGVLHLICVGVITRRKVLRMISYMC